MRRKKKSDIHIVENHEDETDALIDEVLRSSGKKMACRRRLTNRCVSIGRVKRQRGLSRRF